MARKAARAHNVAHLRPEPPKRARAELEFDEPTVLGALFGVAVCRASGLAPTMITLEMALVTPISGECSAGVTFQTT